MTEANQRWASACADFNNANEAQSTGDEARALTLYRRAISQAPVFAEAHMNLGNLLATQGELDLAIQHLRAATRHRPEGFETHYNLALALRAKNRLWAAAAAFKRSAILQAEGTDAHAQWRQCTVEAVRRARKTGASRRVLPIILRLFRTEPKPFVGNELGLTLLAEGRTEEAVTVFAEILDNEPAYLEALQNLPVALGKLERHDEAIEAADRALGVQKNWVAVLTNKGNAHKFLGQLDTAIDCYGAALELDPEFTVARVAKAVALLLKGDYENGLNEYEGRPQVAALEERPFWDGQALGEGPLVVHAEQGIGDLVMFARYLPGLEHYSKNIYLVAPPRTHALLAGLPDRIHVVAESPKQPCHHVLLMSLARHLGTTATQVPQVVPFLAPGNDRIAHWAQVLRRWPGIKVGFAFQGNPHHTEDGRRSVRLSTLNALAVPGLQLFCLQQGHGREQLDTADFPIVDLGDDIDSRSGAFMETAAILKNLDIVISVDSALAHVAGTLGVETWVLLRLAPDWRWRMSGQSSAWYPTLRLFRQKTSGDWAGVVDNMRAALQERVAQTSSGRQMTPPDQQAVLGVNAMTNDLE